MNNRKTLLIRAMGEYGGEGVVQDSLREEQEENERLCRVIEYAERNMEKAHEDYRSLSDRHLELLGAVREFLLVVDGSDAEYFNFEGWIESKRRLEELVKWATN